MLCAPFPEARALFHRAFPVLFPCRSRHGLWAYSGRIYISANSRKRISFLRPAVRSGMHGSSPKWSDALAVLSPFTEQAPVVLLRSIRQLRGQSVHSGILFSFKKPLLLRSGQLSAYYSDVVVPEDAAEEVSLSALLSAEEAEASDDVSSSLVMFSFS